MALRCCWGLDISCTHCVWGSGQKTGERNRVCEEILSPSHNEGEEVYQETALESQSLVLLWPAYNTDFFSPVRAQDTWMRWLCARSPSTASAPEVAYQESIPATGSDALGSQNQDLKEKCTMKY